MPKAVVIGAGFAGMSAASFLAKEGFQVTVIEKHATPGGRARQLVEAGFTFDRGPSWYWMHDIFERYFNQFGKSSADYYSIKRLDPSYRIYWEDSFTDIPANLDSLKVILENFEPGAAQSVDAFLAEAASKYEAAMHNLVFKPGRSVTEFMNWETVHGILKLDLVSSMKSHVARYFKHPRIRQLMEFPILFLGALPEKTPALYSLMNYADIVGGTWYPERGMYSVVQAMYDLATELGVKFCFSEDVKKITIQKSKATSLITGQSQYAADVVIGSADYYFIENSLLPPGYQGYSKDYWNSRVLAPSCLLYYVGLNRKTSHVLHHNLFFDVPFSVHGQEIYKNPRWPSEPLFYVNVSSVTDRSVAPPGCENLMFLVPVAAGLEGDDEELREKYFYIILRRFEKHVGQSIEQNIVFKKSFASSDFVKEYNSFKGNAYGLANTLTQTALFKPSCRSRKVRNLFYTGQLTVPGPGVPPSLISGEVVAGEVVKAFGHIYRKSVLR